MSVIWEIQKAVYEKLTGDSALMAMITGVYDYVPERSEFPYVTVGDIRAQDSSKLGVVGYDVDIIISTYSLGNGRKEALEILDRIKVLMGQEFAIGGYSVLQTKFVSQDSSLLKDARTYQVKQEYRVKLFAI